MITGNLGKPGASCGIPTHSSARYLNPSIDTSPKVQAPPDVTILKMPGIVNDGLFGTVSHPIKSLFITGSNPIGNAADRNLMIEEVFKKLDFIVVADIRTTDTTEWADILLPAAHWFEEYDLLASYARSPYMILQEKAAEPQFEAKSDFNIYQLLSKELGIGEAFDFEEKQYIELLLDTDLAREDGMTLANLEKDKALALYKETYIHGKGGVFPTPTKRAEFYHEAPAKNLDFGQDFNIADERLPIFIPPSEAWYKNPRYETYPFNIISEHTRWRVHSSWSHVPLLREIDTEPIVKINPMDASVKDIHDGDSVRVFNDRGEVVIKAIISSAMRPGSINIPKGWHYDQFISGHYNNVTSTATDNLCVNTPFFDALVQIEKV
jgi:molybdopterin-containing oxidoreductase family molybdopterin binding subunit